jgi:hypothetical protein
MKPMVKILEKIGKHTIIRGIEDCPVDPEATGRAVAEQIAANPALADADPKTLFETHAVYFVNFGPERKLLSEAECPVCQAKFDALKEHQRLTEALEIISDFRDIEYWQKTGGRWAKQKITDLEIIVPADAVLPDALTEEQRAEIAAQERADRIAALSPAEKEAEKEQLIKAAIHEANIKRQDAELEAEVNGEPLAFDAVAWARERKSEIEAMYA